VIIVTAVLKTQTLDGIEVMDAPIGKVYRVDLESVQRLRWFNTEHGRQRDIECILDVDNGGYLPIEILEMRA
jgi:hypothetical protein